MIVSYKHDFIFIKTRKTGGSTLEYILRPYLDQTNDVASGSTLDNLPGLNFPMDWNGHLGRVYLSELMDNKSWNHFRKKGFIFTIERNPWDKVVSQFYWFKQRWGSNVFPYNFKEYVKGMTEWSLPSDHFMYAYGDDSLAVHKIFKYEEMWELHDYFFTNYDIDITEKWANTKLKVSENKPLDYRKIYNDNEELISTVGKLFKKEIKLLGYTYE